MEATDGHPLGAHLYAATPDDDRGRAAGPRALVVINGATGVPQGYYRHFATFLAGRGCTVLTYDYRGIGASRGEVLGAVPDDLPVTMEAWGRRDFAGVLAWAGEEHPDLPRVVVGHSFGGQAFGLADLSGVDAAVHVAAQEGWHGHWRGPYRLYLIFLWYLALPAVVHAFGRLPRWMGLGEELPQGVALDWIRWARTPGYLAACVEGAQERYKSFRGPLLSWSFEDDDYAPKASVEALLARIEKAEIDHRHLVGEELPGGEVGHFGFFRPGPAEVLWERTVGWLEGRLGT